MTWENFKSKFCGPGGTLSSRLPDGGSREQLLRGARQGREALRRGTLPRAARGVEAAWGRSDQAGPTRAGGDWFVAHRLQVCGLSESKGGWAFYALGHTSVPGLPALLSGGPPSLWGDFE